MSGRNIDIVQLTGVKHSKERIGLKESRVAKTSRKRGGVPTILLKCLGQQLQVIIGGRRKKW